MPPKIRVPQGQRAEREQHETQRQREQREGRRRLQARRERRPLRRWRRRCGVSCSRMRFVRHNRRAGLLGRCSRRHDGRLLDEDANPASRHLERRPAVSLAQKEPGFRGSAATAPYPIARIGSWQRLGKVFGGWCVPQIASFFVFAGTPAVRPHGSKVTRRLARPSHWNGCRLVERRFAGALVHPPTQRPPPVAAEATRASARSRGLVRRAREATSRLRCSNGVERLLSASLEKDRLA